MTSSVVADLRMEMHAVNSDAVSLAHVLQTMIVMFVYLCSDSPVQ